MHSFNYSDSDLAVSKNYTNIVDVNYNLSLRKDYNRILFFTAERLNSAPTGRLNLGKQ